MTKASPTVVHLGELHRYICSSEYRPQISSNGKHELNFVSSRGMLCNIVEYTNRLLIRLDSKDFRSIIRELAEYTDY